MLKFSESVLRRCLDCNLVSLEQDRIWWTLKQIFQFYEIPVKTDFSVSGYPGIETLLQSLREVLSKVANLDKSSLFSATLHKNKHSRS